MLSIAAIAWGNRLCSTVLHGRLLLDPYSVEVVPGQLPEKHGHVPGAVRKALQTIAEIVRESRLSGTVLHGLSPMLPEKVDYQVLDYRPYYASRITRE